METITAKEAIAQGYEYFVFEGLGDQTLNYITDITDDDYDNDPVLCSKEPTNPVCPDPKDFGEWVVDQLHENWNCDDSSFERELYTGAMKNVDFTDIVNKIRQELKGLNYYKGINIKLVRE